MSDHETTDTGTNIAIGVGVCYCCCCLIFIVLLVLGAIASHQSMTTLSKFLIDFDK